MIVSVAVGAIAVSGGFVAGLWWRGIFDATDDLLDRLVEANEGLRARSITNGTLGGSCSCCGAYWYGEVAHHEPTCDIILNDLAIFIAGGDVPGATRRLAEGVSFSKATGGAA